MQNFLLIFLVIFIFSVSSPLARASTEKALKYDLLIKNATIYDGTLKPPYRGDVAISGDTIVKIGKGISEPARKIIQADGLVLTPGFIDLHTHVDWTMYFLEARPALNYLYQGVTTVLTGQCGGSAWPLFEKPSTVIEMWKKSGLGPNVAPLVGHGAVRERVMGNENREPTPEELEKMKALVKEAMEEGAWGLSTGLIYQPGSFARTEEIIELAKVIAPYGGIYHSHIRNEGDGIIGAIEELIQIAEKAGVPAHISHIKLVRRNNWGRAAEVCALIEKARARGLRITADQYPYRFANTVPYRNVIPREIWAGSEASRLNRQDVENIFSYLRDSELIALYKKVTPYYPLTPEHEKYLQEIPRKRLVSLVAELLIPLNRFQGPENERERNLFYQRLVDPAEGPKIREALRKYFQETISPEQILIGICPEKNLEGKTLVEASRIKAKSIEETAIELELMGAKCIPLQMSENDIRYFMKKEYVATGSDGIVPYYGIDLPHIRSYSTFLYKIKRYALEEKVITLSQAIRSQTSLPAEIMGWKDRGLIREGNRADLVLLDLKKIQLPSSVSSPHAYARGVEYLVINGQLTIEKGKYNGAMAGSVLLKKF
ncbi:MAG: D-aminoacylase [Candidatus Saccharicenans sp.]